MSGARLDPAGVAVLKEIREAKASNDIVKLEEVLRRARDNPQVDRDLVESSLAEIEALKSSSGEEKVSPKSEVEKVLELGKECKEKGNGSLKANTKAGFREAGDFYSRGLKAILTFQQAVEAENQKIRKERQEEGQVESERSDETSKQGFLLLPKSVQKEVELLLAQLYANRGHCALSLRDFAGCVSDCKKAILFNPTNIKAYFRAAKASYNNSLFQQCIDFCKAGLVHEASSSELQSWLKAAEEKLGAQKEIKERLNRSPQEFLDQQKEVEQMERQLQELGSHIQRKRNKRRALDITSTYVGSLGENENCYVGCGRAFLAKPKPEVTAEMAKQILDADEELPKMEKAFDDLNKRFQKGKEELEEVLKYLNANAAKTS